MRIRQIATAVVIVATVAIATPAQANVGTSCSAWKTTKTGGHQSACYVRSADWQVAAKGRGYYDGSTKLVQMNISVSLQSSIDADVSAVRAYRARTFLVLFEANGTVRTTNPSYSPITS